MIVAKYSDDWKGERPFPERSSFTIKGYDLEVKKWECPTYDLSKAGKFFIEYHSFSLNCTLWEKKSFDYYFS